MHQLNFLNLTQGILNENNIHASNHSNYLFITYLLDQLIVVFTGAPKSKLSIIPDLLYV